MANRSDVIGCTVVCIVVVLAGCMLNSGAIEIKEEKSDTVPSPPPPKLCKGFGQCCQGKNNTCRSTGPRLNDANTTFCFCDSACLAIGDCCTDYEEICPRVDCELADKWDDWSECDVRCGPGIKERHCNVTRQPKNGGKECGITVEKIPCEGTNCKIARAGEGYEELRETGKIVPAAFGSWRRSKVYSPFQDIRKNLFEHYEKDSDDGRKSYCMKFELTEVRGSCKRKPDLWSNDLEKGATACVECQPMAMKKTLGSRCKGHGVYLKETRWKAVTVPGCHGKWTMQTRPEECQCDPEDKLSFILI